MFEIHYTSNFKKSFKVISKRGYNMKLLQQVISFLEDTGTIPERYKPHKLSGDYSDTWECHIKADWLLLWLIDEDKREIWLIATGTHSDLFK
jgi:mRNA interferase YafQ